jgi:hypothetical protein
MSLQLPQEFGLWDYILASKTRNGRIAAAGGCRILFAYEEIFYCKTYLGSVNTFMCDQKRDRFIGNMEVNISCNVEKSIKSNTKCY